MANLEMRPVYMVEDQEGMIRECFARFSDAKTWFDQHLFDNGMAGCAFVKDPNSGHTLVFDYSRPKNRLVGRVLTIEVRQHAFATTSGW